MITATCPECDNQIRLRAGLQPGQLVKCGRCGEILSLRTLNPPTLVWALEEAENGTSRKEIQKT